MATFAGRLISSLRYPVDPSIPPPSAYSLGIFPLRALITPEVNQRLPPVFQRRDSRKSRTRRAADWPGAGSDGLHRSPQRRAAGKTPGTGAAPVISGATRYPPAQWK